MLGQWPCKHERLARVEFTEYLQYINDTIGSKRLENSQQFDEDRGLVDPEGDEGPCQELENDSDLQDQVGAKDSNSR